MNSEENISQSTAQAWRLDGRLALVTGASRGLGKATAMELARLGANLLIVARDSEALDGTRDAIQTGIPDCRITAISADLSSEAGRDRVVDTVMAQNGLHILVNNVGTNIRKRLEDFSLEEYRSVQETNLVSCFEMCV